MKGGCGMKAILISILFSLILFSCGDSDNAIVTTDETALKTELVDDNSGDFEGVCSYVSEYVWQYRYKEENLGNIYIQNSQEYIFVQFLLSDENLEKGYTIKKLYLHLSRFETCADNFDATAPVYMANITDKAGATSFTFKVDRKYLNFPVLGVADATYNDGYPFYFAFHGIVKTGENNEPWYKSVLFTVTNCE